MCAIQLFQVVILPVFMHALPRKHWACAVFFPRLPFSSWQVLLYSGMVRCVLCLTNIDRVCVVLFPRLLSVCTLCYIHHCSCMRSLPHKYQNFPSHARCHVIWHDVWPLWPIVVCSPVDFAMLERVVLVVFERFCSQLHIFVDSPLERRGRRTEAHCEGKLAFLFVKICNIFGEM